jgi:phosphoribosyl 1,2-cyclic phosphodiesterase
MEQAGVRLQNPPEWISLMPMFQSLASGSSANCGILSDGSDGILLDLGMTPKRLAERLGELGISAEGIRCAVLTHTHSDHWKETTLSWMASKGIRLWCHESHAAHLRLHARAFQRLMESNLISHFQHDYPFRPGHGWDFYPIHLSHDCIPTFGFRCEHHAGSMAYLADLGTSDDLPWQQLGDLQALAIESNHDPEMLERSSRPVQVINRIRSDQGHLSNRQCAEAASRVSRISGGKLASVLLLHLSRDCNTHQLALDSTRKHLASQISPEAVSVAPQDRASIPIRFGKAA